MDRRPVKKGQHIVERTFAARQTPARHYNSYLAYFSSFLTFPMQQPFLIYC
jgi:hypothetical protein